MKNILKNILKLIARSILNTQNPKVVAVVGSIGKTSTKDAVKLVLENKFKVRSSQGSYNNELGVPLTIIGLESGNRNIFKWLKILFRGLTLSLFRDKDYPRILILELGVDKPGDMDYLLSFINPDVVCLTAISDIPVHLKNFKNVEELVSEKLKIVKNLTSEQTVVLNYDNRLARKARDITKAKVITYGQGKKADVRALNITRSQDNLVYDQEKLLNLNYKLAWRQNVVPVRMPYIIGKHQIYTSLAAVTCGLVFDMNLVEISQSIYTLRPPRGRMNLIKGIKYTHIIDDSYNASPDPALAALNTLNELQPEGRKIAILGDMLELGVKNEEGHRQVGKRVAEVCDLLVTVGDASKFISSEARNNNMDEKNIFEFDNEKSQEAAKFVQNKILKQGDLVLIKGSQAMRMERAVKELMAEPMKAPNLLARQDKKWQNS